MFQPGEPAIINPEWYSKLKNLLYDIKSLSAQVEVTALGVKPTAASKADAVPKGTRWVGVKSGEIHVEIPEHHLQRPFAKEVQEDSYVKMARERREAPLTRFNGKLRPDSLPKDLSDKLGEALCAMTLEHRGHFGRGEEWLKTSWYKSEPERRKEMLTRNLRYGDMGPGVNSANAEAIIAAHEAGKPLDEFIPVTTAKDYFCPNCIASEYNQPSVYETNGLVVRPVWDCPCPDGLDTSWEMDFPSGKMLVGNDFRGITRIASERNINMRINTHLSILDYAEVGYALGLGIGNTCPGLYRMPNNVFEIGSKRQPVWQVPKVEGVDPPVGMVPEPEGEEDECWWTNIQPADRTDKYDSSGDDSMDLPGVEELCSICTDLWAYSIIDLEEARKRYVYVYPEGNFEEYIQGEDVIDIEPGRYRFQHFLDADRDSHNVTMARFERIGDAGIPFDFVKVDTEFDVHLTQAAQIKLTKGRGYRKYFGDATPEWAHSVAHLMSDATRSCVPERDWHRNGFPNRFLFSEIEGVEIREIPRFRFQYLHAPSQWNDALDQMCRQKPDKMFGGVQKLNESYAIGMGHLLESLISFGCQTRYDNTEKYNGKPNPNYDTYDVDVCRKGMKKGIGWWKALIKHYPHVADAMPDFAAWMKNTSAVKLWIANFDLGPEKFDRAAEDAKRAKRAVQDRERCVLIYIINNPGVVVVGTEGEYLGMVGVVAEPEAKPGHTFVQFATEDGDAELVELSLTAIKLTEEAEALRLVKQEEAQKKMRAMMAARFAD